MPLPDRPAPAAGAGGRVVRLDSANERLRAGFLRWQCRIRQIAMRRDGGRPSAGMAPLVSDVDGDTPIARVVTVLCKRPEHSAAMELRHLARRTHDPAQRREDALRLLAERYYQAAREFSDTLTASFTADSATAAKLAPGPAGRHCRLAFAQFGQRYDLRCTARRLAPADPLREATFWHNLLFNPRLPADCAILGFEPDWSQSRAEPSVA